MVEERVQRRLAAILAADVVGYAKAAVLQRNIYSRVRACPGVRAIASLNSGARDGGSNVGAGKGEE